MNHYSDPSLSAKTFHSGNFLQTIAPIEGVNILQQTNPASAMEFKPDAFTGLGGYGFPDNTRSMIYDTDPTPFQVERTIGVVFSLDAPVGNNRIWGFSRADTFNTHYRIQTGSNSGGFVNFGRQETELGEFPIIIPLAAPGAYIMVVRQLSLDVHEFYINSFANPVIINPQDAYWTAPRVRLVLGQVNSTRSEVQATIGPIFDCMSIISDAKLKAIMTYLSARTGIAL